MLTFTQLQPLITDHPLFSVQSPGKKHDERKYIYQREQGNGSQLMIYKDTFRSNESHAFCHDTLEELEKRFFSCYDGGDLDAPLYQVDFRSCDSNDKRYQLLYTTIQKVFELMSTSQPRVGRPHAVVMSAYVFSLIEKATPTISHFVPILNSISATSSLKHKGTLFIPFTLGPYSGWLYGLEVYVVYDEPWDCTHSMVFARKNKYNFGHVILPNTDDHSYWFVGPWFHDGDDLETLQYYQSVKVVP